MKYYCICESQGPDQPSLRGGMIVCPDCQKPVCCDAVVLGLTPEPPHNAEIGDGAHLICWRHWDIVAPPNRHAN